VEARSPRHLQPDRTETCTSLLPRESSVTCQHKRANQSRRHPSCNAQFTRETQALRQLLNQAQTTAKRTQLVLREPDHQRRHPSLHRRCIASATTVHSKTARSPSKSLNLIQASMIAAIPPRPVQGERFGDIAAHRLIVRRPRDSQRSLRSTLLLVQRRSWQCFVKKSGRVFGVPIQPKKEKSP